VLPALILKFLGGKKLVYDIFDFYADMLRFTPTYLKKLIRMVDLKAIDRADAVILADDSRIQQISGSHPHRSVVIYNSPEDQSEILNTSKSSAAEDNHFKIAYIGNMQIERGLLELIEVLSNHPEWRLDLAGFGGDEEIIQAAASNFPNITWHGRIHSQQALVLNSKADVIIATYDPKIPNHRYSSPNKLFEAMMLGKPVVVASGSNIDRIVEQEGCGIVVTYGDLPALDAALTFLHLNPPIQMKYGQKARKAYENTYAWTMMKNRLLGLYQDLTY
jgi:glycosyltransferase involved in cell wall biosynthesis